MNRRVLPGDRGLQGLCLALSEWSWELRLLQGRK
jgi:hypothetical protein